MFDIELLRLIWWMLLGILLMGFAISDGFDLGVASLLPFVAQNEKERRTVLHTIRPFWEGNQVWIILGAGAIFAAWPYVYAVLFSGAYFLIFLLLLTLGISRPVSFKYRDKLPNLFWRRFWDWITFIGGLIPAILFGLLAGNVITGFAFHFDDSLRLFYDGSLPDFFHPFSILCGATSLCLFIMHGGIYLAMKTENPIRSRSIFYSKIAAIFLIILFAIGGFCLAYLINGYEVKSEINPLAYSNPLHKEVITQLGAWMNNYYHYPVLLIVPLLGFLGAILTIFTARFGQSGFAFVCSSLSIMGVIGSVGVSLFPFILPSSSHLSSSLLVWDSSSSALTLTIMLFSTVIFLPIILSYTAWIYKVLGGKAKAEEEY